MASASTPLSTALSSLASQHSLMEYREALAALRVYVNNLLEHPTDERYRRFSTLNLHFYECLGRLSGWRDAVEALGFEDAADSESQMDFPDDPTADDVAARLREARDELERRLVECKREFASWPSRLDVTHAWKSVKGAGEHSEIGVRPTMEDDEILIDEFGGDKTCAYFGLYDGHGGRDTVDSIVRTLHVCVDRIMKESPDMPIPEVFEEAYLRADGHVRRDHILQSGTTAVTCIIRVEEDGRRILYTANVGDSRAVLCRMGKGIRLTKDHKASDDEERERVTQAGGFVSGGRVNGVLAISRALGDHLLKLHDVVTARPYTTIKELDDEDDQFLIIACDGVWDVMTDQEACEFVIDEIDDYEELDEGERPTLNEFCTATARGLVERSLQKRSMDNVTVIIVML